MANQPLVSVLTTAYNRELYIREAIESVLASTYSNFELIIVDDGSKDNTVAIAREYEAKDKRVKVYLNEKNLGDYPNRNRAASLATGKYIKYVDADDSIYPAALQTMVTAMENNPEAAIAMIARDDENIDKDVIFLQPKEIYQQHFYENGFLENGPLSAIIRKDVFEEVGGFSGKRMIGDIELWLKITARYPLLRLPKGLVYWRQHEGQEFKKGAILYLTDGLKMYADILKDKHCPLPVAKQDALIKERKKRYLKSLFKYFLKTGNLFQSLRVYKFIMSV